MKLTQKQRTKKALEIANQFEETRAGFFSRNSDNSMTIFIRGAHGNDPNQWLNARKLAETLGSLASGDVQIDRHAGLLYIVVKDVYTGNGN